MSERQTFSALAYLHPDYCFIVDDDSMEGAGIRAGDIVAFTACDHAEDGQIVAVQTDTTVLLLRVILNGHALTTCPACGVTPCLYYLNELPGAKIIGVALEVRHIFKWVEEEWAKEGIDNEEE